MIRLSEEHGLIDPSEPLQEIIRRLSAANVEEFLAAWTHDDGTVIGGLFVSFVPDVAAEGAALAQAHLEAQGRWGIDLRHSLAQAIGFIEGSGKSLGITHAPHANGHYRVSITTGEEDTLRSVGYYERAYLTQTSA